MYAGFSLRLEKNHFASYLSDGNRLHSDQKKKVESTLDSFSDKEGNLIASRMQANWFPPINAQVFISHSHRDIDIAIRLSGWLKKEFGLDSFIDSCAWGYADNLLKLIDDKFCLNPSGNYSYTKRNRSTSHVHMMLSTALSKMMDKAECVIFLNTPSSISPESVIDDSGTTYSPWIYTEIAMTRLIRRKRPAEHRQRVYADSLALDESLKVKYDISLDHLRTLSEDDLVIWRNCYRIWKEKKGQLTNDWQNPLDALYEIKRIVG